MSRPLACWRFRHPLVVAAYAVLRDAELEPYTGRGLSLRASLCALAYVMLVGAVYPAGFARFHYRRAVELALRCAPFILAGGLFAMATLDLDFGDGVFHYGFYLLATMALRWLAGMKWVWDVT